MARPQNEDSNQTTEASDIQLTASEAIIVSNESTALPETSQINTVTSGGTELGQSDPPMEEGQICQGSAKVEDLSEIAKDLLEVSETLKSFVETTNDSTTTDNSKSDSKNQEQGSNDTPNCDDTSQNTD